MTNQTARSKGSSIPPKPGASIPMQAGRSCAQRKTGGKEFFDVINFYINLLISTSYILHSLGSDTSMHHYVCMFNKI